jgi:hypothetical protein
VNAALYALRELGRRAGVDAGTIARWRVEPASHGITLWPDAEANVRVEFPHGLDFLPSEPLFEIVHATHARCRSDLLFFVFATLSRWEELENGSTDEHGRLRAASSLAGRCGLLERPVVDECGLELQMALQRLMPRWQPAARSLRVKLSHDLDQIGVPPSAKTTLGHLLKRGSPRAFARDVASTIDPASWNAYARAVLDLAAISQERGLDSAFYVKASGRTTPWDTGYRLSDPRVRRLIEALLEKGCEIGLHPAYDTYGSQERLEEEVAALRRYVGAAPIGGRMHYLRWDPSTWTAWERAGLAYDSTLGFHDGIGFRAGTALPYHPWLMKEDRESALLEIPLIVMDCTPIDYMGLGLQETLRRTKKLVERCARVGGVFTLLWHNQNLIEKPYAGLYRRILEMLPSNAPYRWEADLTAAPLPRLALANGAEISTATSP